MEKIRRVLCEGQKASMNLEEVIQRGNWSDKMYKTLALLICRDLGRILNEGISGPIPRSATIAFNEDTGMPMLQSVVEKGNWPDQDSQPYALLLCENITRALKLCEWDHPLSEGCGENLLLEDECADASPSQPVKSQKIGMKKRKWTFVEGSDGFKWNKYGTKMIKDEKYKSDYYRCAYEGCPARQQRQQTDEAGGFKVFCKGTHICKGLEPAS